MRAAVASGATPRAEVPPLPAAGSSPRSPTHAPTHPSDRVCSEYRGMGAGWGRDEGGDGSRGVGMVEVHRGGASVVGASALCASEGGVCRIPQGGVCGGWGMPYTDRWRGGAGGGGSEPAAAAGAAARSPGPPARAQACRLTPSPGRARRGAGPRHAASIAASVRLAGRAGPAPGTGGLTRCGGGRIVGCGRGG